MKSIIGATALFLAIGVGAALGQTDTPAPAAPPAAGSKMTADQKKAISKSCSDQANAKGLHGGAELRRRLYAVTSFGEIEGIFADYLATHDRFARPGQSEGSDDDDRSLEATAA